MLANRGKRLWPMMQSQAEAAQARLIRLQGCCVGNNSYNGLDEYEQVLTIPVFSK